MSNLTRAHVALALVAVLYGANYIIAKITLGSGLITPQGFIMLRALAACFFLWVAHALFVKEKLLRNKILKGQILGIVLGLAGAALLVY